MVGCFRLKGSRLHFNTIPEMITAYRSPVTCAKQKSKDVPVPLTGHMGGGGGGGGGGAKGSMHMPVGKKASLTCDW